MATLPAVPVKALSKARIRKNGILATARTLLREPPLVVVAALTRGDVPTMTQARVEFRARRFVLKKMPNTLCRLAVADTERAFMQGLFVGQTVVAYPMRDVSDETAPDEASDLARRLLESLEQNPHVVLMGGALNDVPLYAEDFKPLAKMASRLELRADLARALRLPLLRVAQTTRAPLSHTARTLVAPTRRLGRALAARQTQLDDDDDASSSSS